MLLIIATFVLSGALPLSAKGQENKENKGKNKDKTENVERSRLSSLVDAVLPYISTTTVLSTSTPDLATSTPSTATTTATTTPVTPGAPNTGSTATTSQATSTPPITSTSTPPTTSTSTPATTTPPVGGTIKNDLAGLAGQVNDILGDNFFTTNYYGNTSLSAGVTRSLKFIAIASAVVGLGLLVRETYPRRRIIHNI
jgi:hypothetical protein